MESTQQTMRHSDGPLPVWTLTVVHHPRPDRLGRRLVLEEGTPVTLGRDLPTLDAEGDKRLSRAHALVRVVRDVPTIEDRESRNGTHVDGERVTRAELSEGALIGVGGVLLLCDRRPPFFDAPDNPRVAGVSRAMGAVLADVARVAPKGDPVLFFGETGVGKGLLAEELHLQSGRRGPLVAVHCGALADDRLHAQLFGEGEQPGLLESAETGTLFFDGIDDARPALQAAVLSFLERAEVRRVGEGTARPLQVRVVLSSRSAPRALVAEGKLRDDLAARVSGWSLEIPPLRARREDITAIAARLLGEMEGKPALHHDLAYALLTHSFPGNVHELQAVLARAAAEASTPELRMSERIAAMLHKPAERAEPVPKGYAVARSGAFFDAPGVGRVSLDSRKVLAGLLRVLASAHERAPGRPISVAELVAAGWPGEKILPRSGASRVYVSITSLRKMGLRDALDRTADGYSLDPAVRLIEE